MKHPMKHLRADEEGASAIEFAFCATILAVLVLGLVDFGMGFWDRMQVDNAVRAGAAYAVVNGYNQTNIQTAANNATYAINISNLAATASEVCGCPDPTTGISTPTGGSATPPCTGTCTNGNPGTYVTVSASGNYTPIFPWPGLPSPMTFNASAIVRIN